MGSAWDSGLAFTLAETGHLDEAAELFGAIAEDDFAAVPRELNWLVVVHLLGLTALRLGDAPRAERLLVLLEPFSHLDATHGSGYVSYGPTGRGGRPPGGGDGPFGRGREWFDDVLATRAPGPWTSLTRLDRAGDLGLADPEASVRDADRAATELDGFAMPVWAAEARALGQRLRLSGHGDPIARRVGAHVDAAAPGRAGRRGGVEGHGPPGPAPGPSGRDLPGHRARHPGRPRCP